MTSRVSSSFEIQKGFPLDRQRERPFHTRTVSEISFPTWKLLLERPGRIKTVVTSRRSNLGVRETVRMEVKEYVFPGSVYKEGYRK